MNVLTGCCLGDVLFDDGYFQCPKKSHSDGLKGSFGPLIRMPQIFHQDIFQCLRLMSASAQEWHLFQLND